MKFLADMGISPKTITFLNAIEHDATHLHAQKLDTLSDSKILEKSLSEGRILLTHDLDFGELVARSGGRLPSVIIFRRTLKYEPLSVIFSKQVLGFIEPHYK